MKKIVVAVLISVICSSVSGSDTYHLTLEQSIEIAKEKSYRMLQLKQSLQIAEYNLQTITNRLKTHIDLNITAPQYSEEIRTTPDTTATYYSVKQLNYNGNLTINQPLPTDGRIYVENKLSAFDDLKNEKRSSNMSTRIGFEQPLDAFYGYNNIKSTLKKAQLAYEQSNKSLKREELELIYLISRSYYNLLSLQKSVEIAYLNLERQTEAFEISKNKYEAGLIREVDALQMEVDLAEAHSSYDIAILSQSSSLNSFKESLGINLTDSVILNSEMKYKIVAIDPEKAVSLALENRLEIREQEIQIELQKLTIKEQKANGMISSKINAYWGKEGAYTDPYKEDIYSSLSNSINYSYRNMIDRPYSYGVGFTISVPILDWGENRSMVRAAEARLKQNTYRKEEVEREIETKVRNLVSSVQSNLKRLQLLEKNVSVAEKSFEITRQRFSDGDIDSQSLALERNRLNNAYTTHLGAYINYQLTLTELMKDTYYDFQNESMMK